MKVVVLVPYRAAPEREKSWGFVRQWITSNYGYDIWVADCDGTPFSSAQARNRAAALAGDWDVAVIHDADTIAHPEAVRYAVAEASASLRMVFAGDSHMYCDPISSQRIMLSGNPGFARPVTFDERGVYPRPSGGVLAVSRTLWDATGGYLNSLTAWGFEDLVFLQCAGLFGEGHSYIPGHITLHLWHPPLPETVETRFNERIWRELTEFRIARNIDGAKHYLAGLGHTVP